MLHLRRRRIEAAGSMPFGHAPAAAVDVVAAGDPALLGGELEPARARAVAGVGGQGHRAVQSRRSCEAVLGAGEVAGRPARPARDAVEPGLDRLATRVAGRKNSSVTLRERREPRFDTAPCLPEGAGVDDQVTHDRKPCERLEQERPVLRRSPVSGRRGQGGRRREPRTCRTWRPGTSSGSRSTRLCVGAQGGHRGPWRARRPPARSAGGHRRRCARSRPTAPSPIHLIVQEDHSRIRITTVKANASIRV